MSERTSVDVLVVGAGPAGSAAAIACARAGIGVMLVERCVFPREKVCGGCVSPTGMRELASLGVAGVAGVPLGELEIRAGERRATVGLARGGVAVAREAFDVLLADRASENGASIVQGVRAELEALDGHGADVVLRGDAGDRRVRARVVVAADGLAGSFGRSGLLPVSRETRWSRVGVGARAPADVGGVEAPPGRIVMHCAPGGYVGLVRLGDGTLDVGGALSPRLVREAGGPGAAVCRVIEHASGANAGWTRGLAWRGTATLTRRRAVRAASVLFVGDSAGYVEPFTGEGISWALRTGALAGEFAARMVRGDAQGAEWESLCRAACAAAHRRCLLWTRAIRLPVVLGMGVRAACMAPMAGAALRSMVGGAWSGREVPAT